MSFRRRRANNFTNSLNSFQYSELESHTHDSISHNSLDVIKSKSNANCNDIQSSKYSIILAGSSVNDFLTENSFTSSVIPPKIQDAPDLNKRIDLFHVEDQCGTSDDKENNKQYFLNDKGIKNNGASKRLSSKATKGILVSRNTSESNTINEMLNRDSNYNIHDNKPNVTVNLKSSTPKATLKSNGFPISKSGDKLIVHSTSDKQSVHKESEKFELILCTLDNELNQLKEVLPSENMFKRLSGQFMLETKNFTEKLLTIIEETVFNSEADTCNASAITLSRLTAEFKKMCKFIEDESAPEWPASPVSQIPICKSPEENNSTKSFKNVNYNFPTNASLPSTPICGTDILRRRFLNKISKNNSISESSNSSFEQLETQCKRLFPEETEYSKHLRRSLSEPSLLSMSQIQDICNNQMAELNEYNIHEDDNRSISSVSSLHRSLNKLGLNSSNLKNVQNDSKQTQYENTSYCIKKSQKSNEKTDFNKMESEDILNSYVSLDPDEFEKTLLQDIAGKRKRCLDTVKLITEMNADPEAVETQITLKMSPLFNDDNESNSLTHNEYMFLKSLISCKDYQMYLEKRKPLLDLLQNLSSCTSELSFECTKQTDDKRCEKVTNLEKQVSNEKQSPNTISTPSSKNVKSSPNVLSHNLHKSPLSKTPLQKKEKPNTTRPKFFVTPGKTPPSRNKWKKKEYFPAMTNPAKSTVDKYILKSPHAEGLYRLNYTTIMSPVGMYIRGTDMPLLKNVHAKTDNLLFKPTKNDIKASPSRNLQQNSTSRNILKTQAKTPLKLNLSPKIVANKTCMQEVCSNGDTTPKSRFVLPKVSYKLPLQVKTIKGNEPFGRSNSAKKLLKATGSKVVIRHEGRINSVQRGRNTVDGEIYEISYAPENESIHIEQAASKTNSVHRW